MSPIHDRSWKYAWANDEEDKDSGDEYVGAVAVGAMGLWSPFFGGMHTSSQYLELFGAEHIDISHDGA